jgi:hypothetical protein
VFPGYPFISTRRKKEAGWFARDIRKKKTAGFEWPAAVLKG